MSTRLSACVNIIPSVTSVYRWKGSVESESEVLMMIKTRNDLIPNLTQMIRANHPHEVFELITVPVSHDINYNKIDFKYIS